MKSSASFPFSREPLTPPAASILVSHPSGVKLAVKVFPVKCMLSSFSWESSSGSFPSAPAVATSLSAWNVLSRDSRISPARSRALTVCACTCPRRCITRESRSKSALLAFTRTGSGTVVPEVWLFCVALPGTNRKPTSRNSRTAPSSDRYSTPIASPCPLGKTNFTGWSDFAIPVWRLNVTPRVST